MKYSLDKYRYANKTHADGRKSVIAISTFAGKTVRGVATCDVNDAFNEQYGKELAAARCNQKVAVKRQNRAQRQIAKAEAELERAKKFYSDMLTYYADATDELNEANNHVNHILESWAE